MKIHVFPKTSRTEMTAKDLDIATFYSETTLNFVHKVPIKTEVAYKATSVTVPLKALGLSTSLRVLVGSVQFSCGKYCKIVTFTKRFDHDSSWKFTHCRLIVYFFLKHNVL